MIFERSRLLRFRAHFPSQRTIRQSVGIFRIIGIAQKPRYQNLITGWNPPGKQWPYPTGPALMTDGYSQGWASMQRTFTNQFLGCFHERLSCPLSSSATG
jgi:hypothetical protein